MKTKKVLGSILDTLDFCCRKADAKTLKFLAFAIGSQSGTTKTSIRTNILVQAHELQRLANIRSQRGKLDITAIDMGLENFAFAKFSWRTGEDKPQLIEWTKLRLDGSFIDAQALKPSFVPKSMSLVGHKLTEVLTQTPPDIFVIERQRTRTMGSANIPDPILKVNALEHILFAYLNAKKLYSQQTKGTKEPLDYLIESSDPRRMTDFWCKSIPIRRLLDDKFGEGSPKAQLKATSSTLTKMLKISLVKSQIMEQKLPKFNLSPELTKIIGTPVTKLDLFELLKLGNNAGKSKDDDLADSLLHGLAWLEWVRNFEELAKILESNQNNEQALIQEFKVFNKAKKLEIENFSQSCILHL